MLLAGDIAGTMKSVWYSIEACDTNMLWAWFPFCESPHRFLTSKWLTRAALVMCRRAKGTCCKRRIGVG